MRLTNISPSAAIQSLLFRTQFHDILKTMDQVTRMFSHSGRRAVDVKVFSLHAQTHLNRNFFKIVCHTSDM